MITLITFMWMLLTPPPAPAPPPAPVRNPDATTVSGPGSHGFSIESAAWGDFTATPPPPGATPKNEK